MRGRKEKPKSCPECGGDLKWMLPAKVYVCTSCGLQLTAQELMEYRHLNKQEKDEIKEYVDWWFSKK